MAAELRDHQNDRPSSVPQVVPRKNPKIVERKVKPISVQAAPAAKNFINVSKMSLGFDQKKPSIQPWSAAACHSAIRPARMPTCAATMASVGQSFCAGRRRTERNGRASGAGGARTRSTPVSWTAMSGRLTYGWIVAGHQQRQAALLDRHEFGR